MTANPNTGERHNFCDTLAAHKRFSLNGMRYINPRFTYLLTHVQRAEYAGLENAGLNGTT